MMVLLWSLMAAAGPAEQAHARVEALGPHVATYVKESTGQPRLEVHYFGPEEASFKLINDEGHAFVSVDADHKRIADGTGMCVSVELGSIFAAADKAAMGLDTEAFHPHLSYRPAGGGNLDVSAGFQSRSGPMLFSWHADLGAEDTSLSEDRKTWLGTRNGSIWAVSKKTGLLERMTIGGDALVLSGMVKGKKAQPMASSAVCGASTDADAERQLRSELRLMSVLPPYSVLVREWDGLDEGQRAKAVAGLEAWWKVYYAEELPMWSTRLEGGPWKAALHEHVADKDAFLAFREALSPDEKAEAMAAWQTHWFVLAGTELLGQHYREIRDELTGQLGGMQGLRDERLREPLLFEPMEAALTAAAEGMLTGPMTPVLASAGQELERALAEGQ